MLLVRVDGGLSKGVRDPVTGCLHQPRVEAQGFADHVGKLGMWPGSLGSQLWNMFAPVPARPQEPGVNDDVAGTLPDAVVHCHGHVGSGNFHVCRFDDPVACSLPYKVNVIEQLSIALLATGSVVDDNNAQFIG